MTSAGFGTGAGAGAGGGGGGGGGGADSVFGAGGGGGGAGRVLVKVHMVVCPDITVMAAGVPFVQVALVRVQPAGTVSLTL